MADSNHFTANIRGEWLFVQSGRKLTAINGWPVLKCWRRKPMETVWYPAHPNLDIVTGTIEGAPDEVTQHLPSILRNLLTSKAESPGGKTRFSDAHRILLHDLAPIRHYFSNIPADVRAVVSQFHSKHWRILELVSEGGTPALQLLKSNPALGFCLASYRDFLASKKAAQQFDLATVLRLRQRDICALLGFTSTEAAVSILKKVDPDACSVTHLIRLRSRLREKWIQNSLLHMQAIRLGTMSVLCSTAYAAITTRFLAQIARDDLEGGYGFYTLIAFKYVASLHQHLKKRRMRKGMFTTIRRMRKYSDKLNEELDQKNRSELLAMEFPPAPFCGDENIVPLDNPALLKEEADEQYNCVTKFAADIRDGQIALYRIEHPERATFSLTWQEGRWALAEIAGRLNANVADPTRAFVLSWLDKRQKSPDTV